MKLKQLVRNAILVQVLIWSFQFHTLNAQERYLLTTASNERLLMDQLLDPAGWVPFPSYADRQAWRQFAGGNEALFVSSAEKAMDYDWPSPTARDYLAYVKEGSREPVNSIMRERRDHLKNLVLGELMEGKGRFMEQIMNGVWAYCESTTWSEPAHFYLQKAGYGLPDSEEPTIDLNVGEVSNLLAWTWFFFREEFDRIDPLIGERLHNELYDNALDIYYDRIDFWWMSFDKRMHPHVNNWNPWINFNMLNTILLVEEDSLKRAWYTAKTMRSVDHFINTYPEDGGCDEGPGYWNVAGGALFEYLDLLSMASGEKIAVFEQDIIQKIGTYITKVSAGYPYVLNFADAGPTSRGNPQIVYRYGKAIGDAGMMDYAAFLADQGGNGMGSGRSILATLLNLNLHGELTGRDGKEPLPADFYLPDLQLAGGRDRAGSTDGFFFGMKAGHNGESHNHNDVGSFMVYYKGRPVLIDVGVATYIKATFDPVERWKLWYMQSQYHNTPLINGCQQAPGRQFRARDASFSGSKGEVRFGAELSGAYPEKAAVKSWKRDLVLKRGKTIRITENFKLAEATGETSLSYMTCIQPEEVSSRVLRLRGEDFSILLDGGDNIAITVEEKAVEDSRLRSYWGDRVYRIRLVYKGGKLEDFIRVELRPE